MESHTGDTSTQSLQNQELEYEIIWEKILSTRATSADCQTQVKTFLENRPKLFFHTFLSEPFSLLKTIHFLFSEFSYLLPFYFSSPTSLQISFYGSERNTAVPAFSKLATMLGIPWWTVHERNELASHGSVVTSNSFSESHSLKVIACEWLGEQAGGTRGKEWQSTTGKPRKLYLNIVTLYFTVFSTMATHCMFPG